MYLQYFLGAVFLRVFRRGSGLDEALGFGDVVLSGVLGLILGWPAILVGLLLTIFLAGAGSLIYLVAMLFVRKYRSDLSIPYGPYLVLSAVLVIFFSDALASLFNI
jgi:leader peptidase (prepilin peptidase)/N-methyltransferase